MALLPVALALEEPVADAEPEEDEAAAPALSLSAPAVTGMPMVPSSEEARVVVVGGMVLPSLAA